MGPPSDPSTPDSQDQYTPPEQPAGSTPPPHDHRQTLIHQLAQVILRLIHRKGFHSIPSTHSPHPMTPDPNTISFIVSDSPSSRDSQTDTGGSFRTSRQPEPIKGTKQIQIPVEQISTQMNGLLLVVDQMFAQTQTPQQRSGLQLDEIELGIEVNASGQISIIGTGLTTGGKGAITLKFKRS